jgi:hypothetical protein
VLRAAGETETVQENIEDWLKLDEGDKGRNCCSDIFLFSSELPILLNCPFRSFLWWEALLVLSFVSLIWIIA